MCEMNLSIKQNTYTGAGLTVSWLNKNWWSGSTKYNLTNCQNRSQFHTVVHDFVFTRIRYWNFEWYTNVTGACFRRVFDIKMKIDKWFLATTRHSFWSKWKDRLNVFSCSTRGNKHGYFPCSWFPWSRILYNYRLVAFRPLLNTASYQCGSSWSSHSSDYKKSIKYYTDSD